MRWMGIAGSAALTVWSLAWGACAAEARVEALAEGALSQVEEPFVAVIADSAAYAELRAASRVELPDLPADSFRSRAVVAVFLGNRPTPGYKAVVRAAPSSDGFEVIEESPPRDAVLAQVLTAPFVVASVPANPEAGIRLSIPDALRRGLPPYRVEKGRFEVSGGIAGIASSFEVTGEMRLGRLGKLATIVLDLRGAAEGEKHALAGLLTGLARAEGAVSFGRLPGGGFVPAPCSILSVDGRIADETGTLALCIASVPCNVADAFGGSGNVVAVPSKGGASGR